MLDFIVNYLWLVILILLAIIVIARTIRIVPQSYAYVVERLVLITVHVMLVYTFLFLYWIELPTKSL